MLREFSSTQIDLPESLAQKILRWGKKEIRDEHLHPMGRETEIHVTVLYGLHSASSEKIRQVLASQEPFTIELSNISIFSNSEFDVVKIGVLSPVLHELHKKLAAQCEHTDKFPKYQPHVTIAYVEKGQGWKLNGNAEFKGQLFDAESVVFSSKSGKKESIKLTRNSV